MEISPQITRIDTDYKKNKKISVISVICGPLFFIVSSMGSGELFLKKIPVIIITASALKEQEPAIKKAGADGHLNKPVSRSALIKELKRFLP